jgi:hypothetical protein
MPGGERHGTRNGTPRDMHHGMHSHYFYRSHELAIADIVRIDRHRRFVLVGILIPIVKGLVPVVEMVPVPPAAYRIVGKAAASPPF